jgi:hypothetical protein
MADMTAGVKSKPASVLRKDPPVSRDVHGTGFGGRLKNTDPTRRYVGVFRHDETALENKLAAGYRIERVRPGGPEFLAGHTGKEGDPLLWKGNIIVSIDIAQYREQMLAAQANVDAMIRAVKARTDDNGRAIRQRIPGVRIDSHEVNIPEPVETMEDNTNG